MDDNTMRAVGQSKGPDTFFLKRGSSDSQTASGEYRRQRLHPRSWPFPPMKRSYDLLSHTNYGFAEVDAREEMRESNAALLDTLIFCYH